MRPIERLNAILAGQKPDRWPFVPSIYEHGAALLGKPPSEVARDAGLMADAAIAGYHAYQHDLVTVGIDIYNIEAEAFGCEVSDGEGASIPGIPSHPLASASAADIHALPIPEPGAANRLGMIEEASREVASRIGGEVWVNACMGGPFSQSVELRGFEYLATDNELVIDTQAPVVTVDPLTTYDTTPRVTGTIVDDHPPPTVTVTVDGHEYPAPVSGTTWTLADDTIAPALADGTYDVTDEIGGALSVHAGAHSPTWGVTHHNRIHSKWGGDETGMDKDAGVRPAHALYVKDEAVVGAFDLATGTRGYANLYDFPPASGSVGLYPIAALRQFLIDLAYLPTP